MTDTYKMPAHFGGLEGYIGRRILQLRSERAIPRQKLAHHIGLTDEKLRLIEAGIDRPDPNILITLCRVFDVNPSTFFPEEA